MPFILARHHVEDYERWRPLFDGEDSLLRKSNARSGRVFRNADDSGEIVVLLEWDSLDEARDFMNQPELARDMNRAGVIEKPQIVFLEELDAAQLGGNG